MMMMDSNKIWNGFRKRSKSGIEYFLWHNAHHLYVNERNIFTVSLF